MFIAVFAGLSWTPPFVKQNIKHGILGTVELWNLTEY